MFIAFCKERIATDRIMSKIKLHSILDKLDPADPVESMARKLSVSELNSMLLEVFRRKSERVKSSVLLHNYIHNRFVKPSDLDPLILNEFKRKLLKAALKFHYRPIELSPLMPFACCSAMGPVDQNNIVSALRNTELLADITNALTLEAACERKFLLTEEVRLCACQRSVRAQSFDNPDFSAHFELFGMVTAGRDRGNYLFEKEALSEHISFYLNLLESLSERPDLTIIMHPIPDRKGNYNAFDILCESVQGTVKDYPVEVADTREKFSYYKDCRMNILLTKGEKQHLIIDGGFTDWTQKLLNNNKERLLTSGLGVEYFLRLHSEI